MDRSVGFEGVAGHAADAAAVLADVGSRPPHRPFGAPGAIGRAGGSDRRTYERSEADGAGDGRHDPRVRRDTRAAGLPEALARGALVQRRADLLRIAAELFQ